MRIHCKPLIEIQCILRNLKHAWTETESSFQNIHKYSLQPLFFSKTDIYREGKSVYIQRTGGEYCPVTVLLHYMGRANIGFDSSDFLFRPLVFHKH